MELRSNIEDKYKWDLTHLYKNVDELELEFGTIMSDLELIKNFEKLPKSEIEDPKNLKLVLDLSTNITKTMHRMYVYAQRWLDQEQNNEDADKLVQKLSDLGVKISSDTKFLTDTIIKFDDIVINNILAYEPLTDYHFDIKDTIKNKKHILSKIEEELLTKISDIFSTPNEVYTIFKNTELEYPTMFCEDKGDDILLDDSTYRLIRESGNRNDRKTAYDTFWKTFNHYKGTLSKLLFKAIKAEVTDNKIRNYDSSLQAALNSDNIPVSVYDTLVSNINNNLPKFHKYLELRKETLGYSKMHYYDLYNPIVDSVNYNYSYDNAKELVLKSTALLGEEYTNIMQEAFDNQWIDIYPNKFKDTGAYMSGSAYDVHPYILMNYKNTYDDVSTLAHELGHAGHSFYSNAIQSFNNSHYSTFIAEIASTTNEILLFDYMYKDTNDDKLKIFLLNNYIEHFRTTVFRQTMFAEFERFMYETVEDDKTLTPSILNDKYLELLKKYHGEDKGIMDIAEIYGSEWSFVPHFYYNFYVFQYATSFIISSSIAARIIGGDSDQLEKYIDLLKSGSNDYPIEQLKKANIDLSDNKVYDDAFKDFDTKLDELKTLIKKNE